MKQRHELLSDLFLRACALPVAERYDFVERECAGDADLCTQLKRMLDHDGVVGRTTPQTVYAGR